jgi:biopolymer transport protein ExbB/TolQ
MKPSAAPTRRDRRPRTLLGAVVIGLPLSAGLLYAAYAAPGVPPLVRRYVSHPVEVAEVVLFCAALGALAAKLWAHVGERLACRRAILPPWDGTKVAVGDANALLTHLDRQPSRVQGSLLARRVGNVLDFLRGRGSASELDDHLRTLADNDALALDGSYGLVRFITWAIPILGFLGTVLGITEAIAGVTPEVLEKSLSTVTDGLALAFDTTALALMLTMVVMLLSFVTEKAEQGVLDAVDAYVDRELAHRFERDGGNNLVEAARRQGDELLRATERLVEQQATVWAKALEAAERRWAESERRQQDRLVASLEEALEQTLAAHTRRLESLEGHFVDRSAALVEQLGGLAAAVREASREQQAALSSVAQTVASQMEALARLRDGEHQLARAQDVLNQNLSSLANAHLLEEAVHSLTAAAHLLTARANPKGGRPGAAA